MGERSRLCPALHIASQDQLRRATVECARYGDRGFSRLAVVEPNRVSVFVERHIVSADLHPAFLLAGFRRNSFDHLSLIRAVIGKVERKAVLLFRDNCRGMLLCRDGEGRSVAVNGRHRGRFFTLCIFQVVDKIPLILRPHGVGVALCLLRKQIVIIGLILLLIDQKDAVLRK